MNYPTQASVLIIASDFPPLVGTNTQRIQSFVRHLPKFGWSTTVVTQLIEDMEQIDSAELARIPDDAVVLRVPNPDPFAVRRRKLGIKPFDAALTPVTASDAHIYADNLSVGLPRHRGSLQLLRATTSAMLNTTLRWFAYYPDALRLWANATAHTVLHNPRTSSHQVMLTSCPTYSTHIAGLKIKRAIGIPWVADFRDLWIGRPFRKTKSLLHDWMDYRLEAAVVRSCDALVLASPAWENIFLKRYGQLIKPKITSITNGFETVYIERLRNTLTSRKDNKKRFVLTGAMHSAESPVPFFYALVRLRESRPDLLNNIEVRLIGSAGQDLAMLQHVIQSSGIQNHVELVGLRSNDDCLREQLQADFLLLFSALEHQNTIRGKSFEYIAVGKPIIACISPDSIQAEILRQAGTALIVPYGDTYATYEAILYLLTTNGHSLKPNWKYIQQFDRQNLAKDLAVVMDTLNKSRLHSKF